MLEPRHVVTPLRDVLDADAPAPGSRGRARPGAAHGDAAATRKAPSASCATTASSSRTARFRACCPIPGLADHAIGFKSLADAIWLRNHVIQCMEVADTSDDPETRQELLTFVFVGGGYAGLEALAELQDFAAEAIETYPRASLQGMRWILVEAMDRVLPEIDPRLADYALRQLRGRGIDIRLGTTLEEVTATSARISTGETVGTRTVVWTAGVVAASQRPQPRAAGRRARSHRGRRPPARAAARTTSGRSATPRRSPTRRKPGRLCPPTSQHAIRQGRTAGPQRGGVAGGRRACAASPTRRSGQFVNLGRYKAVAQRGAVHVPRVPGLVAGADVPREPDPGHGAQGARGDGLDHRAAVQARHRRGRARSATRARCAQTPTSASGTHRS